MEKLYTKEPKMNEIFWRDYFETLGSAISRLSEVINHPEIDQNDFMRDATIQRFEFVMELFWKMLKKILIYEKIDCTTPRDAISKSFQFRLIDDEELWLKMLDDRNSTSHVYKQEEAKRIFQNIKLYLPIFEVTYKKLQDKYGS